MSLPARGDSQRPVCVAGTCTRPATEHTGHTGGDAVATWRLARDVYLVNGVAGWVGRGLRRGRGWPTAPARSPGDRTTGRARRAWRSPPASRPGQGLPLPVPRPPRAPLSASRSPLRTPGAGPLRWSSRVCGAACGASRERKSSIFYMEVMGQDRTHPALYEGTHEVTGSLRPVPPLAWRR